MGVFMEYTKDVIFSVSYGQEARKNKFGLFGKLCGVIGRHKMVTSIIFITLMLMILDCVLVGSFIEVLQNVTSL